MPLLHVILVTAVWEGYASTWRQISMWPRSPLTCYLSRTSSELPPTATIPARRLINIKRPSRLEPADFRNRDVCSHHTESNALPTELPGPAKSLRLNVKVERAFRAGKKIEDKPLIIILESEAVKWDVLKQGKVLWEAEDEQLRKVYINPDLSKVERERQWKVREGYRAWKGKGDNVKIVKGKCVVGCSREITCWGRR